MRGASTRRALAAVILVGVLLGGHGLSVGHAPLTQHQSEHSAIQGIQGTHDPALPAPPSALHAFGWCLALAGALLLLLRRPFELHKHRGRPSGGAALSPSPFAFGITRAAAETLLTTVRLR